MNVPGYLPRWIAWAVGISVLAVLSSCAEKIEEEPALITSTNGQPIVLKSTDGQYSLQVQGKQFVNSMPWKDEIVAKRMSGIPAPYITMLYEATEEGNGVLVYGVSVPKFDMKDKTIQALIASEQDNIKKSPKSWGYEVALLKGGDGDDRYLVSGVNDVTGAVAHETCVGRLRDKLLYVCILTQHEQSWARSALVNMTYH